MDRSYILPGNTQAGRHTRLIYQRILRSTAMPLFGVILILLVASTQACGAQQASQCPHDPGEVVTCLPDTPIGAARPLWRSAPSPRKEYQRSESNDFEILIDR